ncbi:CHAT domain-containing protein [Aspergillus cavernicola]|uniref:CHAT domain-containing protein n=1 Tax=Aspergillus cavernicola TaxID=176166 RepID=A0ABR4IEB4_9EURO
MSTLEVIKLARSETARGNFNKATSTLEAFLSQWNLQGQREPPPYTYFEVQLQFACIAVTQGYLRRARRVLNELQSSNSFISLPRSQTADDPLIILIRLLSCYVDVQCDLSSLDECETAHRQVWDEHLRHIQPSNYTDPVVYLELYWHRIYRAIISHRRGRFPEYIDRAALVERLSSLFQQSVSLNDYHHALEWASMIEMLDPQAVPDLGLYVDFMPSEVAGMACTRLQQWEKAEEHVNTSDSKFGLINMRSCRLFARLAADQAVTVDRLDQEVPDIILTHEEIDYISGARSTLQLYMAWKATRGDPQLPLHLDILQDLETRSGAMPTWTVYRQQSPGEMPKVPEKDSSPQDEGTTRRDDQSSSPSAPPIDGRSSMGSGPDTAGLPTDTATQSKERPSWLKAARSSISSATNFLRGDFSEKRLSRTTPVSLIEFGLLGRNVIRGLKADAAQRHLDGPDPALLRKFEALVNRIPAGVQKLLDPKELDALREEASPDVLRDLRELQQTNLNRPGGDGVTMSPSQIIDRAGTMLRQPHPEGVRTKYITMLAHFAIYRAHLRLQDPVNSAKHAEAVKSILDDIPQDELEPGLKEAFSGIFQTFGDPKVFDPPADKCNYPTYLEAARRQFTRAFVAAIDPVSKITMAAQLGLLETLMGNEGEASEWFGLSRSLISTSGVDSLKALRLELMYAGAHTCTATRDEDFNGIRATLQRFETIRQAESEAAKRMASAAGMAYFCLGYRLTTIALDQDDPHMRVMKLREARLYHQAGLGAMEYSDDNLGTRSYSQFVWGLGETWKYEGITLRDGNALQQAITIFKTAEDLLQSARHNLGSLEADPLRAFDAKTYITGRFDTIRLFKDAFLCCVAGTAYASNVTQRNTFAEEAWMLLQRQKARSVMDILTGDAQAPWYILEALRWYPDQLAMLQQEETQQRARSQAAADHQRSAAEQQLHHLQQRMRSYPIFDDILRFKNGEGLRPQDVQELATIASSMSSRVVFVDWAVCAPHILIFSIVTFGRRYEIRWHKLELLIDTVSRWIQSNFTTRVLSDIDLATVKLKEMSNLIAPLSYMTNPGDTLILCPTGILQKIPLHALEINEQQILLERNPVVYTASHSILRHQASALKAQSRTHNSYEEWRAAVFTVYEGDDKRNPAQEVAAVRSSIAELATSLNTTPQLGAQVTVPLYQSHSNSANLIHFHGHAISSTRAQDQALILHPGPLPTTGSHRIAAINIACNSHKEEILLGDEPLGLNTAFVYAGAQAVVGTLWSLQSADGRTFSNYFYESLNRQASERRRSVGHVAGAVPLVNLATALQESALRIRDEEDTEAPYHWASFVLSRAWEYRFGPSGRG